MLFAYNRAAFYGAYNTETLDPLLRVYCICVVLELGLKEHLNLVTSPRPSGHDLPHFLRLFGMRHVDVQSPCAALQQRFADAIEELYCQGDDGQARRVGRNAYPNLRYIRYETDEWPTHNCSPERLKDLFKVLGTILFFLKHNGVQL